MEHESELLSPWVRIASHSKAGIGVYVVLWSSVAFPTGLYKAEPDLAWGGLVVMTVIAILRTFTVLQFSARLKKRPRSTKFFLILGIYSAGLMWGLLGGAVLLMPELEVIRLPLILCLAGICSGALPYFSSSIPFTAVFNLLCLGPGAMAAFYRLDEAPYYLSIGLIFCIYYLGIFILGRSLHSVYALAFTNAHSAQERANQYAKISFIDSLSQTKNRTYFDRYFPDMWRNAFAHQTPISIAVVDIDNFKAINDTHGHSLGDQCVVEIANKLREGLRGDEDVICRFGGDEFVLVLQNTDGNAAEHIANRLLEEVRSIDFIAGIELSISVGIHSEIPISENSHAHGFDKADRALYQAKKAGRDCVRFS